MRDFFAEASFKTKTGDKLTLVCDFYTISVVEGVTGQNWDDILPQLVKPPRALVIAVLYGLLRKKHEDITIDEAAAISYDVEDQGALALLMGGVIAKACNFDDDKDAPPSKKKPHGRSRASAKSG